MKKFAIFLILLLALPSGHWGRRMFSQHTAANCSDAAFETAKLAAEADTAVTVQLTLPACTATTWTSAHQLVPPATASTFIFNGAGSSSIIGGNDQTIIVDGYMPQPGNPGATVGSLLVFGLSPGTLFQMTGITWRGGTPATANYKTALLAFTGTTHQFRADHVHCDTSNSYYPAFNNNPTCYDMFDYITGVIDHGLYDFGARGRVFTQHFTGYDAGGQGDGPWAAATGLGGLDFLVMEDNTVNNTGGGGSVQDCFHAGKFVIRFNTLVSVGTQTHPTGGSGRARGCRAWEIYGNNFTQNASGIQFNVFFLSSGTGVIWGNTATPGAYTNFITAHSMRRNNGTYPCQLFTTPNGWGCSGTSFTGTGSNWDQNTVVSTGFRPLDQPGNGIGDLLSGDFPNVMNTATGCVSSQACAWPRQALEPIYEWLDSWSCSGCGGSLWASYEGDVLIENNTYYINNASFNGTTGVGSGTLAARPSTCTPGVAYWATDQGSWRTAVPTTGYSGQGVRYNCPATNIWVVSYTPLIYPHPLVTGGGNNLPPIARGFSPVTSRVVR